jgi:hypothetical protein
MSDDIARQAPLDLSLDEAGDSLSIEALSEGTALGTWASATTASTASCPTSSASSSTSASSFG